MSETSRRDKILVTGANGFIGSALCSRLEKAGYSLSMAIRKLESSESLRGDDIEEGDIGPDTDWSKALKDVCAVVHLAARAHVLKEVEKDNLEVYRRVNVKGTDRLARFSASMGVKRFVFLSSIGVNGNFTHGRPFREDDETHPQNSYSISKLEAEEILKRISTETGLETVIVRAPLVYGPRVKGNILRLLSWVNMGMPLPLRGINNRRSLIGVDNLVDLIVRCLESPQAKGELFVAADKDTISTPELIGRIAAKLDRPARLFPFPLSFLRAGARVLGMRDVVERLSGSLVVDTEKANRVLGWSAPVSLDEGIEKMARWFKSEHLN